jgi:hypothetical protein
MKGNNIITDAIARMHFSARVKNASPEDIEQILLDSRNSNIAAIKDFISDTEEVLKANKADLEYQKIQSPVNEGTILHKQIAIRRAMKDLETIESQELHSLADEYRESVLDGSPIGVVMDTFMRHAKIRAGDYSESSALSAKQREIENLQHELNQIAVPWSVQEAMETVEKTKAQLAAYREMLSMLTDTTSPEPKGK